MIRFNPLRLLLSFVVTCVVLSASSAQACSVPVFRYALERWVSDQYQVTIFHRGDLTKSQKLLAKDLGPDGLAGRKHANVQLVTVDLSKGELTPAMKKLWASQKNAALPHMLVRYPNTVNIAPVWSGPLTKNAVSSLIDSPARQEIAKRILRGETAIWLLLESGRKREDEVAYNTLKKRLAIEQKTLKLPAIDPKDVADGLIKPGDAAKTKIIFSIIRVSRKDPKEAMLVQMLLGSEGSGKDSLRDKEYVNQTMAFPVFGRGRIRPGLVGAGIAKDTIHESCQYLVGPCTCQLKSGIENRGIDLVTAVNWSQLVDSTIASKPKPPLGGLGSFVKPKKSNPSPKKSVPNPEKK